MSRPNSVYEVVCLCGRTLQSETLQFTCPHCGLQVQGEWPCITTIQGDQKCAG